VRAQPVGGGGGERSQLAVVRLCQHQLLGGSQVATSPGSSRDFNPAAGTLPGVDQSLAQDAKI